MTKRAIILSAGQGSRLLPLTADRPKCLIEFSGRTLLDWQLDMLIAGGIDDITVVVGFNSDMVTRRSRAGTIAARACGRCSTPSIRSRTISDRFGWRAN